MKSRLVLIFFVLGCVAAATLFIFQSRADTQNLTVQELSDNGFYAYIFSEKIQDELRLIRNISIYSFDWHCVQSGDSRWNPLKITYTNTSGTAVFSVTISPDDMLFDTAKAKRNQPITLDLSWIPSRKAAYYILPSGVALKVTDVFSLDVVITSSLDITEVISLIRQLEYVGAEPSKIINPWETACS